MPDNLPGDDDFRATLPPEEPAKEVITDQEKLVAQVGNSPEWELLEDYIKNKVNSYRSKLFSEEYTGMPTEVIGQHWLVNMTVAQEFQALLDEVTNVTKKINDAKEG